MLPASGSHVYIHALDTEGTLVSLRVGVVSSEVAVPGGEATAVVQLPTGPGDPEEVTVPWRPQLPGPYVASVGPHPYAHPYAGQQLTFPVQEAPGDVEIPANQVGLVDHGGAWAGEPGAAGVNNADAALSWLLTRTQELQRDFSAVDSRVAALEAAQG